jgi:hypothetical protein
MRLFCHSRRTRAFRNRRVVFIMIMPVLALFFWGTCCFSQAGKTELFGTITDPSNRTVPKAKVKAEEQATSTKFEATSDERGEYRFLGLPAGEYVLTVEQSGFRTYLQSKIILRIADHTGASPYR